GTGIVHAEFNASKKEPVRLVQMWLHPSKQGLSPSWEQKAFSKNERLNQLLPVIDPEKKGAMKINQDATFYISRLEKGKKITHKMKGKYAYVMLLEGEMRVNGNPLSSRDAAKVVDEKELVFEANADTEWVMWEMAKPI
ncbi:MAG: pirin family protein, partial [archaeon]